jgi:hypothetical protein
VNKPKAVSRPFSIVLDDILRSPKISDSGLRLYLVLLSYCQKQSSPKTCGMSRRALAAIMRMSMSGISKLLRQLSDVDLIKIASAKGGLQTYTVNTDPPADFCPDDLKGRRWDSAVDFIEKIGGLKPNQSRTLNIIRRPKRTGWRSPVSDLADEAGDDVVYGTLSLDGNTPLPPGQYPSPSRAIPLSLDGNTPSPSTVIPLSVEGDPMYREEEYRRERPNGHESSALVPLRTYAAATKITKGGNPPHGAATPLSATCIAIRVNDLDAVSEDTMKDKMPPTPEQVEAERARLAKSKKKDAPRPNTGDTSSPDSDDDQDKPAKRSKKPAKAPEPHKVIAELTADPDVVCEVPDSPYHFYAHFCKAVRKRWPEAQFPSPDGKVLKWGKEMLKQFSRSQLYEMVRLLVLDFENINRVRTFFKYRGTPTPSWLFLYGNIDTLVTFIGVGVIEPPGVRTSPYAEDYMRRREPPKPVGEEPKTNEVKSSFEAELEAIRARTRGDASR